MTDVSRVRLIEQVYHLHAHEPADCPVLPTWPSMCRCCPVHDRHEGCPHD